MKKISEYKDEQALDILADLIEPAVAIFQDPDIAAAIRGGNRIMAVKAAIKNHKHEVMEILAVLDGVPVEEYHCSIISLPVKLLEILNDEELTRLFTSQVQEIERGVSSGPVTASTGEEEA